MMRKRGPLAVFTAIGLTAAIAACGTPSTDNSASSDKSITVWTLEEQPDRLAKAQADADAFTKKTGIAVKLVGVNEDQFPQLVTAAAAAEPSRTSSARCPSPPCAPCRPMTSSTPTSRPM